MVVDGDEAVGVGGQARDARARSGAAARPRGRPGRPPSMLIHSRPSSTRFGEGAGPQPHAGLGEQLGDGSRGLLAEDRQRPVLPGHDPRLERETALVRPAGGEQRELVDRQRPRGLAAGDERDPQRLAGVQVLERGAQPRAVLAGRGRSARRGSPPRRRRRARAAARRRPASPRVGADACARRGRSHAVRRRRSSKPRSAASCAQREALRLTASPNGSATATGR